MLHAEAEIGPFLKARRAALEPAETGLPSGVTRRRVRGLRREEAALLAGISVDYYTRIEQGRVRGVSPGVLDSLARALRLTRDERAYLHRLAEQLTGRPSTHRAADAGACAPVPGPRQTVRPAVRALLEAMTGVPSVVLGTGLDVLAWNRAAALLWPGLDRLPEEELNLARLAFLRPEMLNVHEDLTGMRQEIAARLRAESGRLPDDQRLCFLVDHLHRVSPEFRELWEVRDVRELPYGVHRLSHPVAGPLELHFEKMPLADGPDRVLLSYAAEPGSVSETRLRRLLEEAPADGRAGGRAEHGAPPARDGQLNPTSM